MGREHLANAIESPPCSTILALAVAIIAFLLIGFFGLAVVFLVVLNVFEAGGEVGLLLIL